MKDGIVLINKPAGMTSFGVVARVRRVLSQEAGRKIKVGHTGTLDPFATGLMILVVGSECKNAQKYSKLDKEYLATIRLGQVSTTGDPEGVISETRRFKDSKVPMPEKQISSKDVHRHGLPPESSLAPNRQTIDAVLRQFTGQIEQTSPAFSAIKVDGQRAYKLARQGKEFEIPKRVVTIYELEPVNYDYPELKIRVKVSSGTYIRTLAEDIGTTLGTGAYCLALTRTRVADWRLDDAQSLSDLGINS